jgi:hypothetical protein
MDFGYKKHCIKVSQFRGLRQVDNKSTELLYLLCAFGFGFGFGFG